jgi:hypothetical protein
MDDGVDSGGYRGGEMGHGAGCEASVGQPLHCYSDVPALPWAPSKGYRLLTTYRR